jgi:hypothetical protein
MDFPMSSGASGGLSYRNWCFSLELLLVEFMGDMNGILVELVNDMLPYFRENPDLIFS